MTTPSETIAFAIAAPIGRADLPGLCARVCALLGSSGAAVALCDVAGIDPDAVTVDALARLQLAARSYDCQVRLRNATVELRNLIEFMGLRDVVPDDPPGSGLEPSGEAEEREQRLRVEEEGELGDPTG
jgi:ABC-type transporter Mla MlaB component